MKVLRRIWDRMTLKQLRNEIHTWVQEEGRADRECIYQEFAKFYEDQYQYKNVVNNMVDLLTVQTGEYAKEVTKRSLMSIEIEVFSFCNRRCWFCPNQFIDRHSTNIFMEETVYIKILSELKEIKYKGVITFSRYNEPFADETILKRIAQAREYCPEAFIRTNTNGDYLTKELLGKLQKSGIDEIEIQCYFQEKENVSRKGFEEKLQRLLMQMGLKEYVLEYCNEAEGINARIPDPKIHITFAARNFGVIASNRGGTLENVQDYKRKSNCMIPFKSLYIDYNGSYMLCCNLRSDVKGHEKFILGNASIEHVFDIFTGEKIVNFRKLVGSHRCQMVPCNTCNFLIGDKSLRI